MVVTNRLPASEVARAGLVLLGLCVGAYLLWRVQEVIFLLFLAVLLATAIEPIVNRLRRGPFTRGSGTLLVYTFIILVIAVPAYATLPNLAGQAASFTETLPQRMGTLREYAAHLQPRFLESLVLSALDSAQQALQAPPVTGQQQLVEAGATAIHTIISFLTVFVLAFYWLVERASIKRAVLRIVPARKARDINIVWLEVEEKLGGWVRGQLILMLAVGLMASIGYWLIGLPNPVLLGVAAGLFEIVPMVGPFLAFTPAVLVALAIDPTKAIAVVIFALVIQQLESNILVPRVMGRTVGVSPLTVLLGILVGAALAGLPGAFIAVPVAGAIQVILAHTLRAEDPSQAELHPEPAERAVQQGERTTDPSPGAARLDEALPHRGEADDESQTPPPLRGRGFIQG
ncbi:MAG TPA: AI-2E family transporter [Chloroflexota bacterium]|nr:AI-2E family transporter [Chloroflexota bacterium]